MADSDGRARSLRGQDQTEALAFDVREFGGLARPRAGRFREFKKFDAI
jgi:hypothetical protein